MFTNPFVFYGRIRRMEFGLSLLIFYIISGLVVGQISRHHQDIYMLALFPLFWFRIAQGAKRCHDLNSSGWWQLIPFYNIWLLFVDGDIGQNEYGDNPKYDNFPDYPDFAKYSDDKAHQKPVAPSGTNVPDADKIN